MGDFIDQIITEEGGSQETNDPADAGGRTIYGISERANPDAWVNGTPTYEQAREIYKQKYIAIDGIESIPDLNLMHQVADFGVTSGPDTSVRTLQQILGVQIDGKIGSTTLAAIAHYPSGTLFGAPISGITLLNLAFRDARIIAYAVDAKRKPANLRFILGWLRRCLDFK